MRQNSLKEASTKEDNSNKNLSGQSRSSRDNTTNEELQTSSSEKIVAKPYSNLKSSLIGLIGASIIIYMVHHLIVNFW